MQRFFQGGTVFEAGRESPTISKKRWERHKDRSVWSREWPGNSRLHIRSAASVLRGKWEEHKEELSKLKDVYLSGLSLETDQDYARFNDFMKHCTNVESLDLAFSSFKNDKLPETVAQIGNSLKKLSLSKCNLHRFPDDILRLTGLNELDLGGNAFQSLPQGFAKSFPNLKRLLLDECSNLTFLPSELGIHDLPDLKVLTLPNSIDPTSREINRPIIHALPRLTELEYPHCKSYLDETETETEITHLTGIVVEHTSPGALNRLCRNFPNTSHLHLVQSGNRTVDESEWHSVYQLQYLSTFHCSRFTLEQIPNFSKMPNLENVAIGIDTRFASELHDVCKQINDLDKDPKMTKLDRLKAKKELLLKYIPGRISKDLISDSTNEINETVLEEEVTKLSSRIGTNFHDAYHPQDRTASLILELAKLYSLKSLAIEWLPMKHIDLTSLGRLSQLENLALGNCSLPSFPDFITELKLLKTLDLSGNLSISSLPDKLKNCCGLEVVYLINCGLNKFPAVFTSTAFEKLSTLYLCGNPVGTIPPSIVRISTLQDLDISSCGITELPVSLFQIDSLQYLSCWDNNIRVLPVQSAEWVVSKHRFIDIGYNKLTLPPEAVWKRDAFSINKYLSLIKQSKENTARAKLFLIGESGAGKTSIAKALLRDFPQLRQIEEREPTVLLDFKQWTPSPDLLIDVIDMGGQDEYAIAHCMLASDRPVVLLVVDLSRYDTSFHKQHVDRWIETAIAQTKNAHLVVAGTHGDLLPDGGRQQAALVEQNMRDYVKGQKSHIEKLKKKYEKRPDSKKALSKLEKDLEFYQELDSCVVLPLYGDTTAQEYDASFEVLRAELMKACKEKSDTWPETYKAMYGSLKTKTHIVCLMKEVIELCKKKVPDLEDSLTSCLQYLHDTREILWFSEVELLKNVVFIDPQFVIDVLKALLKPDIADKLQYQSNNGYKYKQVFEKEKDMFLKEGFLTRSLLHVILADSNIDDDMTSDYARKILVLQDMCFEDEEDGTHEGASSPLMYFPWRNKGSKPLDFEKTNWQVKVPFSTAEVRTTLQFFDILPSYLYERFVIRVLRHLHIDKSNRISWSHGMFASKGSMKLLVEKVEEGPSTAEDQTVGSKSHPYIRITVRYPVEELSEMWIHMRKLYQDIILLKKSTPHVIYDGYYECPHCILCGLEPKHKAIEYLLKEDNANETVTCDADDSDVPLPVELVFPVSEVDKSRLYDYVGKVKANKEGRSGVLGPGKVPDSDLSHIARHLPWRQLFTIGVKYFGMSANEVSKTLLHDDQNRGPFAAFDIWRSKQGTSCTLGQLIEQLNESDAGILIHQIKYDLGVELNDKVLLAVVEALGNQWLRVAIEDLQLTHSELDKCTSSPTRHDPDFHAMELLRTWRNLSADGSYDALLDALNAACQDGKNTREAIRQLKLVRKDNA